MKKFHDKKENKDVGEKPSNNYKKKSDVSTIDLKRYNIVDQKGINSIEENFKSTIDLVSFKKEIY